MTSPTSDQLAASVDPIVREYVDARINEAVIRLSSDFALSMRAMNNAIDAANRAIADLGVLKREVEALHRRFGPK